MMQEVPKKNISSRLHDIKPHGKDAASNSKSRESIDKEENRVIEAIYEAAEDAEAHEDGTRERGTFFKEGSSEKGFSSPPRHSRILVTFVGAFLACGTMVVVGTFLVHAYVASRDASQSLISGVGYFERGVEELHGFRPSSAEDNFSSLTNVARSFDASDVFTKFWILLQDGGTLLGHFQALTRDASLLLKEVTAIGEHWIDFLFQEEGEELLLSIRRIIHSLEELSKNYQALTAENIKINDIVPVDISGTLPIQLDLHRLTDFLKNMEAWLSGQTPRRLVLFFENPSELRPGGGFWGSYAELALLRGRIWELAVRDVNEPDRELLRAVVPPKPLQLIARQWRTADANWFFDFEESATQALSFLESSALYREKHVEFDGVVGISARVVADLLAVTGPIKLPDFNATLDHEYFLEELQKRIEFAREKNSAQPKEILGQFMEKFIERLIALHAEEREKILLLFRDWIEDGDLVFFFKDQKIQNVLTYYDATGKVEDLSPGFYGDYLAVVQANVGGGKTDLFMREHVMFQSQFDEQGKVSNHLTITRMHDGKKGVYWWYKVPNQTYVQVFTAPGAILENAHGLSEKTIKPKVNYSKENYREESSLQDVEATEEEYLHIPGVKRFVQYRRNVFAGWNTVLLGQTKTITLDYTRQLVGLPTAERPYRFIFEKQRGSAGEYTFQLYAPVGYKWRENNLPVFEYASGDPPGRLMFDLSLEKI